MKKRFKNIFLGLMIAPLLLSACQTVEKTIEIPYNLDYLYKTTNIEGVNEDYFPSKLSTNDLLMMMETKQDFVLYFYQEQCNSCVELATPKMKKYLANEQTPFNIFSYDARTFDANLIYQNEEYDALFDVTPKTMFFKDGQHYMTLSTKRYTDYNLFSSAMSSFLIGTKIYMASKTVAIDEFINSHDQFLLYFNAEITVDGVTSKKPSFDFYKNSIFPIMKNAKMPTLVISNYQIDSEYKDELYKKFGLNKNTQTWAVIKNQTEIQNYNYIDPLESVNLVNKLTNIN